MRPEQHGRRASEGLQNASSEPLPILCRQVQADLPAFLEEDLALARRQVVQRHLDGCDACSLELATYRDLERTLSQARLAIPAAGDLRPGFYARLAATEKTQEVGFAPFRRWLTDWRVLVPTLTAASLLLGLWQGQLLRTSGNASQKTLQEVAKVTRSQQNESEQNRVSRAEKKIASGFTLGGQPHSPISESRFGISQGAKRASKVAADSTRLRRTIRSRHLEKQYPVVVARKYPDRMVIARALPEAETKTGLNSATLAGNMPQRRSDATRALSLATGADRGKAYAYDNNIRTDSISDTTESKTSLVVLVDEGIDIQVKDRVRDFTDGMHGSSLEYTGTGKRVLNIAVGDEGAEADSKTPVEAQRQNEPTPPTDR